MRNGSNGRAASSRWISWVVMAADCTRPAGSGCDSAPRPVNRLVNDATGALEAPVAGLGIPSAEADPAWPAGRSYLLRHDVGLAVVACQQFVGRFRMLAGETLLRRVQRQVRAVDDLAGL